VIPKKTIALAVAVAALTLLAGGAYAHYQKTGYSGSNVIAYIYYDTHPAYSNGQWVAKWYWKATAYNEANVLESFVPELGDINNIFSNYVCPNLAYLDWLVDYAYYTHQGSPSDTAIFRPYNGGCPDILWDTGPQYRGNGFAEWTIRLYWTSQPSFPSTQVELTHRSQTISGQVDEARRLFTFTSSGP